MWMCMWEGVCVCVWVCVLYVTYMSHTFPPWLLVCVESGWPLTGSDLCRCKNINKQDRGWLWTGSGVKVGGACWLAAFSRSVSAVCLASGVNWPLKWLILATSELLGLTSVGGIRSGCYPLVVNDGTSLLPPTGIFQTLASSWPVKSFNGLS